MNHEIEALRLLFEQRLDALAKLLDIGDARQRERVDALRDTLSVAMDAATRAVEKAEQANDKRFDNVNEFRAQLSDQASTFVTGTEYRTAHGALVDKLDVVTAQVISVDSTVRNKLPKVVSGPAFFIGAGSVIVVVVSAIVGGAIQIGALQTRVMVNTDVLAHLVIAERSSNDADTKQQVDVASMKARANLFEQRIDKLETSLDKLKAR